MKIGFLSDAHGNFMAYQLAMAILDQLCVDARYFLGDAIGYFDSADVVHDLHARKIPCILGNHEAMVLHDTIPADREAFYRLRQHLGTEIIDIISTWPERMDIIIAEKRFMLVHGSVEDPVWGYSYVESIEESAMNNYDFVVCGATHRAFITKFTNGRAFINIGSCGHPRDHGRLGSIGIYDTDNEGFNIIRFDIASSFENITQTHDGLRNEVKAIWDRQIPAEQLCGTIWNNEKNAF